MNPSTPFEDFLKEEHARNYSGTDDDMYDAFESWLAQLEIDEFISLGNRAMNRLSNELKQEATEVEQVFLLPTSWTNGIQTSITKSELIKLDSE